MLSYLANGSSIEREGGEGRTKQPFVDSFIHAGLMVDTLKLYVKYSKSYPEELPEFSIEIEEGELEEDDFDAIQKKVIETVSQFITLAPPWDWTEFGNECVCAFTRRATITFLNSCPFGKPPHSTPSVHRRKNH